MKSGRSTQFRVYEKEACDGVICMGKADIKYEKGEKVTSPLFKTRKLTALCACLCIALTLSSCMASIIPLERPPVSAQVTDTPSPSNTAENTAPVTREPSQNTLSGELKGVRIYWSGEEKQLIFQTANEYTFKYKIFDSAPEISIGQDVSDWTDIADGEKFDGGNFRNIVIAAADKNKLVAHKLFKYVPGVTYYSAEQEIPEQYKYLAQTVSNWVKQDYSLGNCGILTKYKQKIGEEFSAGVTMRVSAGQPIYSPISGEVIYCGVKNDMNTVAVYNSDTDRTVFMLHMQDISPARQALEGQSKIEAGQLLGYAGNVGVKEDSLYIEVAFGVAYGAVYKTSNVDLLCRQTLDPLLLSEGGSILSESKPRYIPVSSKNSNMNNQGMAAQEDGWIYYINDAENKSIYKMRLDGTDSQEVCGGRAVCITVSEGWIYYCKEDSDNNIYKVRVSGGESTRLNKHHSNFLIVVDDWIYFRNAKYHWRMYRMKTDGSNLKRITSASAWGYVWYNNALYHMQNRYGGVIYKADLTSATPAVTRINADHSDHITVAEDLIYYINRGKENYIYKIKPNGKENKKAFDIRTTHLNYADGWLYFNDMDNDRKLYRIDLNGENKSIVVDMSFCIDINIVGDWLFFRTEGSVIKQYMMNLKTSECIEIGAST